MVAAAALKSAAKLVWYVDGWAVPVAPPEWDGHCAYGTFCIHIAAQTNFVSAAAAQEAASAMALVAERIMGPRLPTKRQKCSLNTRSRRTSAAAPTVTPPLLSQRHRMVYWVTSKSLQTTSRKPPHRRHPQLPHLQMRTTRLSCRSSRLPRPRGARARP